MCSYHISRTSLVILQLGIALSTASGQNDFSLALDWYGDCITSSDCRQVLRAVCKNSKCICESKPEPPCVIRSYGDECRTDKDCNFRELNLICTKTELRSCRCRRGLVWDTVSERCYNTDDTAFINKFDPTRDIIIPSVILMTLGATAWLCFRLFCNNCSKTWRRRRRAHEVPRALEEAQLPGVGPSQSTTWVASYRVFGPLNGVDTRTFPPCLLLPAGPPPYEEALKHKVILSSYQPPPTGPHIEHAQL